MHGRVAIVGAGYEGFRPLVSDLSTRELMFEAASKAYRDASIDPRTDVGSFVCCTEDFWEGWSITDEMVPDQLGAAGRTLCTVPADAITGLGNAMMHILSGVADVAVLEAHSKAGDVLNKREVEDMAQEPTMIRPLGLSSDGLAAMEMDGFLRNTRYTTEDVTRFLIDSKEQAMLNPRASFAGVLRQEDLSEIASSPLRRLDRSPYAEAGIVLVLASEQWAKKNRRDPVFVEGVAWNSSLPWYEGGGFAVAGYAKDSYREAMKRAERSGLGSFDILEVDDTYSYKGLQHLHSLVQDEHREAAILRGEGPALNPSGGSLGVGNLLEASALHRLLECYLQLNGEAGPHQVPKARTAIVQSWRGVPTATGGVAVLAR
jgi:acetyl-CoA C-acetyltransferase